jgi:hypothetical protein
MSSLIGCVRVTISSGAALRSCRRRRCTGLVLDDGDLCRTCQDRRRRGKG